MLRLKVSGLQRENRSTALKLVPLTCLKSSFILILNSKMNYGYKA